MSLTRSKIQKYLSCTALALVLTPTAGANTLPLLGDYSSSIISLNTEHKIGQSIIRQIRGTNQNLQDPIVDNYIQGLAWDLIPTSQLSDKRILLEVIGNLSVNAFAAPGGVLGIHAGLILTTQSEGELASVISHELAHLSQRHFAAQLENQRINTPFAIATILAGILVTVANAEAGSAVLSGTAANSASANLAFSRKNEQEADRIGMLNLSKAGFDPNAMPAMFTRLLNLQRLQGSAPPEFLLTHPSSSGRVADSKNRAKSLTIGNKGKNSLEFLVVQARLQAHFALKQKRNINHFRDQFKNSPNAKNTLTYALVLAKNNRYNESVIQFKKLPSRWRKHISVKLSLAQVHSQHQQPDKAKEILDSLNKVYPDNTAIAMFSAQNYLRAGRPVKAVKILENLTQLSPDNSQAWYLLAEAQGLAGNKVKLHIARIEYFQLVGQIERAKTQLSFARRERSLTQEQSYTLDDLEQYLFQVEDYMKTKI